MKGLEQARTFYEEKGSAMIRECFPEYEARIAAGLAGSGSQCFGFDDEISRDHDFEQGFCLWLTDEDDEKLGVALAREYRRLTGPRTSQPSLLGTAGTGVMRMSDFYRRFTGTAGAPQTWQDWLYLPSYSLAQAVNGAVFRDDLGQFSHIRDAIAHGMPEDVRRKRISARLAFMAQSGQYNYTRCLARGEEGAAMLAMSEFVTNTAQLLFLLCRRHAPYYKWLLRGVRTLPALSDLADPLEFLLTAENDAAGQRLKADIVEDIAARIVPELNSQELSCISSISLEKQAFYVQDGIENAAIRALHVMEG